MASVAQAMHASSAPGALTIASAWYLPQSPYPISPKRIAVASSGPLSSAVQARAPPAFDADPRQTRRRRRMPAGA